MNSLKAVIIDDERLARNEVRQLLTEYRDIIIVGEANNVDDAVTIIKETKPDLVFLDIQLRGESGFDILEKVDIPFEVVFITAYDDFAIRAFEVNALDYLLKPINPKRLRVTIKRILEDIPPSSTNGNKLSYNDYVFCKVNGSLKMIKLSSIRCIQADRDYTRIICEKGSEFLVLKSMKEWESCLPENFFVRIHRSCIINLEYVNRFESWHNYSYRVYINDIQEPVLMSRRYTKNLKERII